MSDPTYQAAPADRVRPSTVTISSYLLYLVAVLQVVAFLISLTVLNAYRRVYRDAFSGTDQPAVGETVATVSLIGGGALVLLIAVAIALLAFMNMRGRNGSRITTWVLGGIFLCCSGLGLLGTVAGNAMNFGAGGDANVPDQADIQRQLETELPGWYNPVSTLLAALTFLAVLVALILLALPQSNEFFRKRVETYGQPMPGGAYGGDPNYPSYPAYPPGEPPLPPPPGTPPPPGPPPPGPPSDR